jgi:valyl-tRNA synthetase
MQQTKFFDKMEKRMARETVAAAERDEKIQFFQFPANGVTVVIKRTGPEMIAFAVSIASPEEEKFRKLVGKRKALERLDQGAMPAVCPAFLVSDFAQELANLVG